MTKLKVTPKYMDTLSTETGLTHDGGDDNRLHAHMITTDSKDMSRDRYAAMEQDISDYVIENAHFIAYAWNDSSGYDYWTVRQCEDNYIQITVTIKKPGADPKAIVDAVRKAESHFRKYSRY